MNSLVKTYGSLRAVEGISFRVKRGEVFAFLGPNGAGKTTTIEILECLRDLTDGEAYVLNFDVRHESERAEIRKRIGVLPQRFNSFEFLTVRETLEFYAKIFGKSADIRQLMELVDLKEKAETRYRNLSGGLKQRVGVAVAMVNDPEILFLDEPTAGLDPRARRDVWNMIKNLREEGKTVFLTTHYMEEAQFLSDRVTIIDQGRIIAEGSPQELMGTYGGGRSLILRNASSSLKNLLESRVDGVRSSGNGDLLIPVGEGRDLAALIQMLAGEGASLDASHMELHTPSLEDVFLHLTGKRITEEGALQ